METTDLKIFSDENILKQIETTPCNAGCYKLVFYAKNGLPASEITENINDFYLYPSGGTLRDSNLNIVTYSARFDTYRGFIPPFYRDAEV